MRTLIAFAALLAACGDNGGNHQQMDAAPVIDTPACVPAQQRPVFESMMTGEVTIGATEVEGIASFTAPLSRTILFTSLRENESSPQFGGVQCILRDADTGLGTPAGVRCRRNTMGTDTPGSTGEIHIRFAAVTFTSGVTVQRGIANTGFTNPTVVTMSPSTDLASTFVLLGGVAVGGGGWGSNEFQRARFLDASTLDIRSLVAGSETSYQIVTMTGAAVQRGTTTMATTSTSAQESLTHGGLVLASYTTDNAASIAAASLMLRASATDSALQLSRSMGGAALDVSWEVVKLPFFTRSFTTDFAAGEGSKTQAIANLPIASSIAIASNQSVLGQAAGSTGYAGTSLDLLGEAAATLTVTAGTVTVERAASSATASIGWSAVDFSRDECAE